MLSGNNSYYCDQLALPRLKMNKLKPEEMIEELMFYIHQNEMGGDCIDPDNRFFVLYLELQKLLDKLNNDRHDLYVSVKNDEVKQ